MDYTKADCWSVAEAAILVCGLTPVFENGGVSTLEPLPPIRAGQPDRIKELRNLAYRALDTGDLPPVGKRKLGQVRPADFLSWAESKGYPAPEALRTAFLGGAKTQPPSEPGQPENETDTPLPGKGPIERRKRLLRIINALHELDPDLDLKHLPGTTPDFLELCQALDSPPPKQFSIAPSTLSNCIDGWLAFEPGRKPGTTTYYRDRLETLRDKLA